MKPLRTKIGQILNHKLFLVIGIVLLTAIYTTQADRNFGWTKVHEDDKTPIFSDASGYYAWMPEWFIYKNNKPYDFHEKIRERYPESAFISFLSEKNGQPFNKYYPGTAVAIAPFFGIGHIIAGSQNLPQDGYSKPYQMMAVIGAIFYFLLGLIFTALLLRRLTIDRFWILVTLCIVAFGSNMGYYVFEYVPTSHVFSFAFCSLFALFAKMYADTRKPRLLFFLAAALGMIFLIRPTNILIVFLLPFFFAGFKDFTEEIRNIFRFKKTAIALSVALFGTIVFFHLFNNHAHGGGWEINSYPNEKFDYLLSPKIGEVLFGFRKGFFIYAPAMLLFFPGMVMLYRKNRFLFSGIAIVFLLFTYIIASWWCWWYGGGLGMRPLLDILIVVIIPIAFLFQYAKNWLRIAALLFAVIACKIALTYDYQIRNNIMHYDEMNGEKLGRIFMHEEKRFAWAAHLDFDTLPDNAVKTGNPLYFSIHGKTFRPGKSVVIRSGHPDSTFLLNYKLNQKGALGAKLFAEISLFSENTNPMFQFRFFRDGTEMHKSEYFVGSLIPQTNKFTLVELDIYPSNTGNFDSVSVYFDKNADSLKVRNLRLQQFTIPEGK